MSKVESSSLPSSSLPTTPLTVLKPINTDVLEPPSTNGDFSRSASVSAVQTPVVANSAPSESNSAALGPNIGLDIESVVKESRKRSQDKGRNGEEAAIIAQTSARIATNLVADHIAVLHPDVETPFRDAIDVVERLLPYHVFQQPKEDLKVFAAPGRKGKKKATEEELLKDEIQETKFALECWKRRAALEKRFRTARINSGKHASPEDQLYILTQSILEADRTDTASLNAELRTARQELEKIEREKKAALSQRPQYYSPQPAVAPAYSTPYRGYTYSYGQGYSTQYTYSPYVPPGTSPPAYPAPTYSTTPSTTSHSSAYTPTTSSMTLPASSATTPNPPSTSSVAAPIPGPTTQQSVVAPIPVQLPSSSLAALSALGIIPVPAANAPPAGQPQPAAVLKGTTQNGATICLEINVSSLQANQMNGLAIILSALTSRGVNVDGAASANSRGVPSGSSGSVRASGKETPSANVGVSSSSGG